MNEEIGRFRIVKNIVIPYEEWEDWEAIFTGMTTKEIKTIAVSIKVAGLLASLKNFDRNKVIAVYNYHPSLMRLYLES